MSEEQNLMETARKISARDLSKLVESDNLEELAVEEMFALFQREKSLQKYLPDAVYETDPRDGTIVVFSSARARRPHDNRAENEPPAAPSGEACPICQGRTTGVVDVAALSEGITFINKNLFPILRPPERDEIAVLHQTNGNGTGNGIGSAYGMHFLQWTSSFHHRDWHNMPVADSVIVLERLAALERQLLRGSEKTGFPAQPGSDTPHYGYVSLIKNFGHLVGGSLAHGHQQIGFSNVMPRKVHNNWRFQKQRGESFAEHMLRETPDALLVRQYGPATLLIPYFMRRPYDMQLILKDTSRRYLYQLNDEELEAVARGWRDAIRLIRHVMPRIGRETAYNVVMNSGPGAGLYFEFLPYTQETGGFEQLGLWICQNSPTNAAETLRAALPAVDEEPES